MNLDWCKVYCNNEGLYGGWVSETYVGMAKISLWYFNTLNMISSKYDFQEPEDDPQDWLKKDLKKWLQIRGLDTQENRQELLQRVQEYMDEGAPEVLKEPGGTTAQVLKVIRSLYCLLSRIMYNEMTQEICE